MSDSKLNLEMRFEDLGLSEPVLKSLKAVGYETPSPIQEKTIPVLLSGADVIGQAQTGTGKTAAFAMPLLSNIDIKHYKPQVLVLAPTRELAIQVAEAFKKYASKLRNFHVLPIYGGQEYGIQLRQLKRGVHVIVGTPGRVIDHLKRGTLKVDALQCLVLDEADEMLRMGFIDDVEWVLEQTPPSCQKALFSATMPTRIRKIAQKYLKDAKEITIKARTTTVETTRQRYWMVTGAHKIEALTRILEAEPFDAMLIFVRTRIATVELSERLGARGYEASPLNGEIAQKQRERTVEKLKAGKIDILVATDVAARGLDVDRISHVLNYDIPYDTEAYIHRIGRTGRAGRSGEAILFVAPRERRMLKSIESATRQKIALMDMPTTEAINDKRIAAFKQRITDTLGANNLKFFSEIVEQYRQEHNVPALDIAAALAQIAQGDEPLLLDKSPKRIKERSFEKSFDKPFEKSSSGKSKAPRRDSKPEEGMERFRLEVGHMHDVKPGNIVGAIANEAEIDSQYIGRINIHDDYSTVDLPEGMPKDVFKLLRKIWVAGQQLNISKMKEFSTSPPDDFKKEKKFKKKDAKRPKKKKK